MKPQKNPPVSDLPLEGRGLALVGRAATARLLFVPETRGDPLAAFPALQLQGRPYNRWLSEDILNPTLARWCRTDGVHAAILGDFERASARARAAFARILPVALGPGEPAILAAMGITANLQRTLATLGEFVLSGAPSAPPAVFGLSELWCGLVEYAADSPYFPAPIVPPGDPAKLRSNRRDPGHLRDAFWCSTRDAEARCLEAIDRLRYEVRRGALSGE